MRFDSRLLRPTLLTLCVFLLGTPGCRPPLDVPTLNKLSHSSIAKPVRIGSYFWPSSFWVDVAWKKGWFQEAGLSVERVDINADYFKAFDQLVSGEIDTMAFALFDFILYNAKDSNLVAVFQPDMSFGADALVAAPGIRTTRDLEGKRVGMPKDTYLEFMFDIMAKRDGLDLSKIQRINIRAEDAHTELKNGKLAAVMIWEPLVTQAVAEAKGKRLFTTADLPGVCGDVSAFRHAFADERKADVQAYVNVWHRTTEFIKSHPKEAFAIVALVNKKPVAEVVNLASLDKLLDLRTNQLAFSYSTGGLESLHGTWRQMNDFMLEHKIVTKRLDSTLFLDNSFLVKAKS